MEKKTCHRMALNSEQKKSIIKAHFYVNVRCHIVTTTAAAVI